MRTATAAIVGALIFAAHGCATTGGGGDRLGPVSRDALEAHVRFLASDLLEGRMTGTRGYEVAAGYVESQYRQLGLAPGGTDGYRQDVPYTASLIQPDKSSLTLLRGGRATKLKWKADFFCGCDPLDVRPAVRAPMVFAGYGVHAPQSGHDDYAGLDVRGKIVVLMSGAPKSLAANPRAYYSLTTYKLETAAARGAVGVVQFFNAYFAKTYPWDHMARNAGQQPSMYWTTPDGKASDHWPQLRGAAVVSGEVAARLLEGAPHGYPQLLALDEAGQALPRGFELKGELELRRECRISTVRAPNVIGVLKGSDPRLADEYVVYTAHLDHLGTGAPVAGDAIHNGAYDNAMGVAAMLETARSLAALRPKRSILFVATGGEERGLLGADYFAAYPTVPIASIVANINLDMPLFLYPLSDVVAFGAEHSSLGPVVARAAEAEGWKLAPDPLPDEVLFIRSDQYALVKRGVPAIFLVSGFGSADPAVEGRQAFTAFLGTHYHQPSDDLSRPVHWASAERFVRVNAGIGLEVANAQGRPRWNEGNFFGTMFRRETNP